MKKIDNSLKKVIVSGQTDPCLVDCVRRIKETVISYTEYYDPYDQYGPDHCAIVETIYHDFYDAKWSVQF